MQASGGRVSGVASESEESVPANATAPGGTASGTTSAGANQVILNCGSNH